MISVTLALASDVPEVATSRDRVLGQGLETVSSPVRPDPGPLVPPPPPDVFDEIVRLVQGNPQIASAYVSLASSIIALLGVLIAVRQTLTSRKALEVTRKSLEETQRQSAIASRALRNSEVSARRERLNAAAPVISAVLLPELHYLLTDHDPDSSEDYRAQFDREKENFDQKKIIELDLSGFNFDETDIVWLSGRLILRNDGTTTGLLTPAAWFFDVVEGDDVARVNDSTFMLEPGARTTVFWLQTYSVSGWMDDAVDRFYGRKEHSHPRDPEYNFKHLGIQEDQLFLTVRSPVVPDLTDYYSAAYNFLPLSDDQYRKREKTGYYYFGRNSVGVNLRNRVRVYPGEDRESEREG